MPFEIGTFLYSKRGREVKALGEKVSPEAQFAFFAGAPRCSNYRLAAGMKIFLGATNFDWNPDKLRAGF